MTLSNSKSTTPNSTYPKGGVLCSKERFVVNETFVLLINICGESPALRVAAKRYATLRITCSPQELTRNRIGKSDPEWSVARVFEWVECGTLDRLIGGQNYISFATSL